MKKSVLAVGNQLRYPKDGFPQWVSTYERDRRLWISGREGKSMVMRSGGAVLFLVLMVAFKVGSARLLRAMSGWQIGPAPHMWVVVASSHLAACIARHSILALFLVMLLLSWDLYVCPKALAIASACLRNSAFIRAFVFLGWCRLSFHSLVVQHLRRMEGGEHQKQKRTAKLLGMRLLWCMLTMVLSSLVVFDQVSKSIPGLFSSGKILGLALSAGIGTAQGLVSHFVLPFLASKIAEQKQIIIAVSDIIMNFFIPTVVIMYLDTGCLGKWVALWKPCRSHSPMFRCPSICNHETDPSCTVRSIEVIMEYSSFGDGVGCMVVNSGEICDSHYSGTLASMSRCMHISLLRLQDIWLTKLLTTGLVMPGLALARDKLSTDSGAIVASFALQLAYSMMSSGHLPLMMPVLLFGLLGKGLMARVGWAENHFQAEHVENVAAPAVKMARLLSLMVQLASIAGDPFMLAIAIAYILTFVTMPTSMRRKAG